MNRKEREEHPEESFDGGYHLYAKKLHKERVAKTPERIEYAIQQFEAHGIKYALKNSQTGHFHCWRKSDGKIFQFYAGTGKIMGMNIRGINAVINLLERDNEDNPYGEKSIKGSNTTYIEWDAWEPCGESCRKNCMNCEHNADELFGDADFCKDCHYYSKWESSVHKYCERCGRPRTQEAWDALKKRLMG